VLQGLGAGWERADQRILRISKLEFESVAELFGVLNRCAQT
jgi:hypothetical protein